MARAGFFDPSLSKNGIFDAALDKAGIFARDFVPQGTQAVDQIFVEDGTFQPEEFFDQASELQAFDIAPLSPDAPPAQDQIDAYLSPEPEELEFDLGYPDFWAQAPPDDPQPLPGEFSDSQSDEEEFQEGFTDAPLGVVVVVDLIQGEDSSEPLEEDEFAEGFSDDPKPDATQADVVFPENGDTQLEEDEFLEGFADAPAPDEIVGPISTYDASTEAEEEQELEGFADQPLEVVVVQQDIIQSEIGDAQPEDEDAQEGFAAAPLETGDLIAQELADDQLEEEETQEGFTHFYIHDATEADVVYVEDASAQLEEEPEQEGLTTGPLDTDDVIPVDDAGAQPEEDEFLEGYSADPIPDDVVDTTPIAAEDASSQPDELDDADAQDYNSAPTPDDIVADADYIQPYDDASNQLEDLDDASELQGFDQAPLSDDAVPTVPAVKFGRRFGFRPNVVVVETPSESRYESLSLAIAESQSETTFEIHTDEQNAARPSSKSDYAIELREPRRAPDVAHAETIERSWFDLRPLAEADRALVITDPTYQAELSKPITDAEVLAAVKFLR